MNEGGEAAFFKRVKHAWHTPHHKGDACVYMGESAGDQELKTDKWAAKNSVKGSRSLRRVEGTTVL